jgi:ribose transport system permease protein
VKVHTVRIAAFVISSLSAVTAGIMLGGFSGVSTNVGDGLELQAISAVVLGGAALLGGRGNMPAALAGALTLQALFTLLNFLGLPSPLRVTVQGAIIIGAVAFASWRAARTGTEKGG